MDVRLSDRACQDLRRIDDPSVRAELVYIAMTELEMRTGGLSIQGRLRDHQDVWWRRGVRRENLSDFEGWETEDDADDATWQAFNFVLLYRLATSNEIVDLRISARKLFGSRTEIRRDNVLIVTAVWDNTVIAANMDQLSQ